MALDLPPTAPAAPPPSARPSSVTLAQASAMGTTAGAPAPLSKGPPPGSGDPGAGPAPAMPGQDPNPAAAMNSAPQRPVVDSHADTPSVGTNPSASPIKQGNPSYMGPTNA